VAAPGHKGILARIAEREENEKVANEQLEKKKLMIEAINDPTFRKTLDQEQQEQMPSLYD
jgi:hypothetical protein